ncbi:O-antigen ligase family protein [Sedimentisphaera salicampi]|uniref:O-antigen ligase family protein n=1 Tax=Sedimentisphaera salicampi TaxID=1941349 RepID=UPI000B9BB70B|nr:O-antigen ligase family protein [Sedimentisphaera salicampi]OXU16048.1 Lipid A core - O-antigen ligase [Sedimentisphaera salicampi]
MIEAKYIQFFLIFITVVPVCSIVINRFPKTSWFFLGFCIFFTSKLIDINFFSHEWFRGTSRGFAIGMVDMTVIILLTYAISKKDKYHLTGLPKGSLLFGVFFLGCVLSMVNAENKLFSGFELFKFLRVYTFFWLMNNLLVTPKIIRRAFIFTSFIAIYIAILVAQQKYLIGEFQSSGPFPHQNSMVMYISVFLCVHFSMLMSAKKTPEMLYWIFIIGLEFFCVVSSLSRAGMLCTIIGVFIVFVQQISWRFSMRKVFVITLFALVGMAGLLKALDSIVERFVNAPEASAETRVSLAIAAQKMADENILGVGINNFTRYMTVDYPYISHIDIGWDGTPENQGALVETVYLLTAAETGWYNLGIFIAFIFSFYFRNIMNIFKANDMRLKVISMGLWGSLTAIYVQSTLEWVLRQTNNLYQLMFVFAVINCVDRINRKGTLLKPAAMLK